MIRTDNAVLLPELLTQAEHLPTLPTVAIEILKLSRDDNAGIEDLTAILALDPALTAKVLKLANSAAFRRGGEVTSLERATLALGMPAVQLLALSFSLTKSLPRQCPSGDFDYVGYWHRSVAMAVAARELARLVQPRYQHEAFLCGLLSRIGQLVLAQALSEPYSEVLAQTTDALPTAELERCVLGFDHHQVSTSLLQTWTFPKLLIDVLNYWGIPDTLPLEVDDTTQALCRLIHMADVTCNVIWNVQKDQALRTLHEKGRTSFGIAAVELDAYFLSLEVNLAETATLLDVEMTILGDFTTILDDARDQMMQVSLGAVLDLQHVAAHAQELEQEKQHLTALSQTDNLTGLLNRAGFEITLQQIIDARVEGDSNQALGLLMIDIDHFKTFNDTYGHLVGDGVLKHVAKWIEAATRHTDVAARYGGEEFVVVVPNTSLDVLKLVAERIRRHVSERIVLHQDEPLAVTVSVGGACVRQVQSLEDGMILLKIADQCLYEAKNTGRNRSVCREMSGLLA